MSYRYEYDPPGPLDGRSPHVAIHLTTGQRVVFGIAYEIGWHERPLDPKVFQAVMVVGLDRYKWWSEKIGYNFLLKLIEEAEDLGVDVFDLDTFRVTARLKGLI